VTELIIYTKPECHLCLEMKEIIYKIKTEIPFELNEVNIKDDISLFNEYKYKIPVLKINGRIFAKYRVDENKLRIRLSQT
jgi:hypothetical protein